MNKSKIVAIKNCVSRYQCSLLPSVRLVPLPLLQQEVLEVLNHGVGAQLRGKNRSETREMEI